MFLTLLISAGPRHISTFCVWRQRHNRRKIEIIDRRFIDNNKSSSVERNFIERKSESRDGDRSRQRHQRHPRPKEEDGFGAGRLRRNRIDRRCRRPNSQNQRQERERTAPRSIGRQRHCSGISNIRILFYPRHGILN